MNRLPDISGSFSVPERSCHPTADGLKVAPKEMTDTFRHGCRSDLSSEEKNHRALKTRILPGLGKAKGDP